MPAGSPLKPGQYNIRGKRDEDLDTRDYWLCKSVPGWLAQGGCFREQGKADTTSDEGNKVGADQVDSSHLLWP